MRAGIMRHRITIQSKSVVRDSFGGETVTWTTFATVWAQMRPLSGREYFDARQAQADLTTEIVIRYLAGVLPEMRVVDGDHVYDIWSISNVEGLNRQMVLLCREEVSQ